MKILIYGYGNPGRQDDGLGNEFVNIIEKWVDEVGLQDFSFDSNYQLNIEDAHELSLHDLVIFVDASVEEMDDFCFSKVDASTKVTFTTHAASPGYVVELCRELYGKSPLTYLLHIKGYEWAFREGLSKKAKQNLQLAVDYSKLLLNNPGVFLEGMPHLKLCNKINQ